MQNIISDLKQPVKRDTCYTFCTKFMENAKRFGLFLSRVNFIESAASMNLILGGSYYQKAVKPSKNGGAQCGTYYLLKIITEDYEMLDILLRKQSVTVLSRFCPVLSKLSYCDSALVQTHLKLKAFVEEDSSRVNKTPFEKHFIESLFLNKFQEKVLEYPQLDTIEEVEALKKHAILAQKLITGKAENENALCTLDSEEAVSVLKKLELTGFKLPRIKNGFGYLSSEYTYMQEALGLNPSLSKTVSEHEDFGVYLIDCFGTDYQKKQYLAKLINGEHIVSLATVENDDISLFRDSLNTSATFLPDNQSYKISGEKSWVYNANYANLFILSANITDVNGRKATKPTLFLVDKNTPGIEIHEPIEKIGLKNLTVCNVTFNEVIVPTSCVLGDVNGGNEIIKTVLSKGKLNNGAHCLAIMRKLLKKAIDHCIFNEFFNEDKCDNDYYKIKIGQMVSRIYVVESMTYLLTGRLDSHTDSDVFLESIIIKIFASDSLLFIFKQAMDVLGLETLTSDENFVDLFKDSQFYIACDEPNDYLKLVLSTAGINYAQDCRRNIFSTVSDIFSLQTVLNLLHGKNSLAYKNILQGYLHKMFTEESRALEGCIYILYNCTQLLINKFGNDVFKRHLELKNLADILINVYATAATLGRASRAYCLGVRNQKVDQICAEVETLMCYHRILTANNSIKSKVSSSFTSVASSILNCSKYSDRYSVTKNLMIRNKLNNRSSRSQKKQL